MVVANDVNSEGLNIAQDSMKLNEITNFETSENEICRFFGSYSKKGKRGSIVDVDPFGSPTKYFDCAIRATMHGGMLSVYCYRLTGITWTIKKILPEKNTTAYQ